MTTQTEQDCLFCGKHDYPLSTVYTSNTGKLVVAMKCSHCGAQGPLAPTEAEAIAAWNRRGGESFHAYREGWTAMRRQADQEKDVLKAEIAALEEKLRRLEGIEDCIMEQESKDFDAAMELKALRELREVVRGLRIMSMMGIGHNEPPHWVITKPGHDLGDLVRALAACDDRAAR